jgi:hypothetical protein
VFNDKIYRGLTILKTVNTLNFSAEHSIINNNKPLALPLSDDDKGFGLSNIKKRIAPMGGNHASGKKRKGWYC